MSSIMRLRSGLTVLVSLMESSILSEVDDTSILRTELPAPLWLSSQLATGLSPRAPRSGLERSDFVLWHDPDPPNRLQSDRYRVVNGPRASRTLRLDFANFPVAVAGLCSALPRALPAFRL